MKLTKVVKYFGYACGAAGALLLLLGVLGFIIDTPIFNVKYPYNFFWAANRFIFLGIFCVLATKCCCCDCTCESDKEKS